MKAILLAVSLLGDDLDEAKRVLFDAVENANDAKGAAAVETIASHDTREALDALVKAYALCIAKSDELEKRKEKLVKTMEDAGKDPKTGQWRDYTRFIKARDELTDVNGKLGRIEWIRLAVLRAFPRFRSDGAVKDLCGKLRPGGDWSLRAIVAAALGRIDHAETVPALRSALRGEREAGVRVAILDALGMKRAKDRETVAAVCDQLKDEFWQVKCAAAGALKAIGSLDAVDALIEALKGADGRVQSDVNAALAGITGVDKHGSFEVWAAWWKANREAVLSGAYQPEPGEKARAPGGTTFYGIPVVSKKFAFVIDRSGSMAAKAKWKPDDSTPTGPGAPEPVKMTGDRKIDVARYEVKKALAALPDGIEFTVVVYNREVEAVSDKLLPLTKESRRRVFEWIDGIEPTGATNISDALERALAFATIAEKLARSGIDTIYLLSDGYPTAGIVDGQHLRARIAEVNRVRKVAIHTVAIEPGPDSEQLMRAIAKEHNGTYAKR